MAQQNDERLAGNSAFREFGLPLFVVSFLGLFVELLLIRWIGTEVPIFAYLQNIVLVVCFLGLGMGCFMSSKPITLVNSLFSLNVLLLATVIPFTKDILRSLGPLLSRLGDFVSWESAKVVSSSLLVEVTGIVAAGALATAVMLLIWEAFVPLGQLMGRYINDHPRTLVAYSLNLLGSLFGVWGYVLLSSLCIPPVGWFLIAAIVFLFLIHSQDQPRPKEYLLAVLMIPLAWVGSSERGALETIWSPYQKLSLVDFTGPDKPWVGYNVLVNNVGYQGILDLRDETMASRPDLYPAERRGLSQYDIPFLAHPNPENVLIVGSGTGNDVAAALRHGAKKVTAVEIDPIILDYGKRYHREKPYASERVTVVTDDARAVFARSREKFDLIIFGLLDSHIAPAVTNARLDHFVYTRESFAQVRQLLSEGGTLSVAFMPLRPFMIDRLAGLVKSAFGSAPRMLPVHGSALGWGGLIYLHGDLEQIARRIEENDRLKAYVEQLQKEVYLHTPDETKLTTDNWPYLYLAGPQIPPLYILVAIMTWVVYLYGVRRLRAPRLLDSWDRESWHFFFLGAAFLLFETQNISKAAVVLGHTWIVSAVIITMFLIFSLLASICVLRFPNISRQFAYVLLVASCIALYFVDLAYFNQFDYNTKAIAVGLITTFPAFFAGIVFAISFRESERKDAGLGANLVGALAGGLLQATTFALGIRALLIIVALFYICSMFTAPALQRSESSS